MKFQAGYFRSRDGQDMFFRLWQPDRPAEGAILLVHGLGEHGGRYEEFARRACQDGYAVYAMDNRGHGRSAGKRGHVDCFDRFLDDLETFWLRFGPAGPGPTVLVGQSLGALIALHFLARLPASFAGAVFCSGAFSLPENIPRLKLLLGKILRRVAPAVTMRHGLPIDSLSPESSVVHDYLSDPLVHDRISVQLFFEMSEAMTSARAVAERQRVPALFVQGSQDSLVPMAGARQVYEAWGGKPKDFVVLEGEGHDLFHGSALDKLAEILLPWMEKVGQSNRATVGNMHG
ncbi:MAG: lysophospholipase [candidate division KSB1 bacterium]|nr:lysophospholipase [candidate division KSB1 bacterium]